MDPRKLRSRWPTLAACGASLAMSLSCTPSAPAVPSAPYQRVVEAYLAAWTNHDVDALDSLIAPEGVHEDIAAGFRGVGPASVKEFMRGLLSTQPDLRWVPTRIFSRDSTVSVEWTWTGTFTGEGPTGPLTNQPLNLRGVAIAEVANGRITHLTDYYDMLSAMRTPDPK